MHMYVGTEYSTLLFCCSALSQDEQDDAQLRIEDILQMVTAYLFYDLYGYCCM